MDKVNGVLNLIALVIGLVCFIVWVVALVQWDGKKPCDGSECDTCPFPCDERRDEDGLP